MMVMIVQTVIVIASLLIGYGLGANKRREDI